jgi:hypothetical protein
VSTDTSEPAPRWVADEGEVALLAARIVDPRRRQPIVCLTTQPYLQRPMLNPDAVQAGLGNAAEVWVITRTPHAWRLTESLPPGLDVYGGAARVWWPIEDLAQVDPRDHPAFMIFSPDDADRVAREIATHVTRRLSPPPAPGTETTGVVTAALEHGAEITLVSGHAAFAANAHLASGPIYKAWEAVREGQQVRMRVSGPPPPGRDRIPVSLRPFAPDPWRRLAEVYRPGMDIEGVVVRLKDYGAFVELLPGAEGLLPNGRISDDFVADPGDYVSENDRVVVRLRTLDPSTKKAELSLLDVAEGAEVQPPAPLYPGGPPWLAPLDEEVEIPPAPAHSAEPPAYVESDGEPTADVAADIDAPEDVLLAGPSAPQDEPALTEDATSPTSEPEKQAVVAAPVEPGTGELSAGDGELGELSEAIAAGTQLKASLDVTTSEAERELARLRGQARQLARELREEIAAAELRVLRLGQDETGELLGDAQQEIEALQRDVGELRERLAAAERDREQLIRRARAASERVEVQMRQVAAAREATADAQAETVQLRGQLEVIDDGDPARRFVRELHYTWSRVYAATDDRRRYPFSAPLIGPAFVESLERTPGITRERVLEVCSHVAAGRASEMNGLDLHQLRLSEAGDAPMRVRDDGATAWRVSLQVKTPSARRLHYWQMRDGRIELSKIGVHDDLTIV